MNTIKITQSLICIPSLSGKTKACSLVIKEAKAILHSQKVISKTLVVAKKRILIWGERELRKTEWLINSHLDVVPGTPDQFIPHTESGKVWGRGAADTKSSCAIMLASANKLEETARRKHITFMLVTDEEVGGESTKQVLENMSNLKGAIFLEPSGEKMIVQAKGIMQIKITSSGKSSHGSRPWEGRNALEKLSIGISNFRLKQPSPIKETRETTFNFSILNGGSAINQIPDSGTLWCDIRWNPHDDPKQIIGKLEKVFTNCIVEVVKLESAIDCPKDSKLRESFVESLKTNSINPISGFEHGSSDARHCTSLGIPAIVFGPAGKNLHGNNEWVSIKSIFKVESVINHWIQNI